MMRRFFRPFVAAIVSALLLTGTVVSADDDSPKEQKPSSKAADKLVSLNPQETVLLDKPGKRVLLKSEVVLREGLLEMLCCPKGTKEHESILAVDAKAYVIHTGLLAVGAKPGHPVQFYRPKPDSPGEFIEDYQPPAGQKIDVYLQWKDQKGKLHRRPAQEWIRYAIHRFFSEPMEQLPDDLTIPEKGNLRYDERNGELLWYGPMTEEQKADLLKKSTDRRYRKAIQAFYKQSQSRPMEADWVFAGSGFEVDEETGKRHYRAEWGDLICVANFPSAMLDVATRSSSSGSPEGGGGLLFEAWTERIPPLGTEVTVELIPADEKTPSRK